MGQGSPSDSGSGALEGEESGSGRDETGAVYAVGCG